MKRQFKSIDARFLLTEKQIPIKKILLNVCLNKNSANIFFSAEKGHQMMPFLLLVRQILLKRFSDIFGNS
ncbi:MAG TPA: hypothetical protein DCS35_08295 [Vibrio sp.]|nr:hypothetical protein [Vibrio sp.]